ncbi:MAG: bifunctional homocysteine S-methyltransferase/methylenetetrahydrofolate reductase [Thermomicrobiales bacterium]
MMSVNPLDHLLAKRPVLADGAMGTMLYSAGIPFDACFDEVNITHPDLVGSVHRAYLHAGADIIETNSFGANAFKLNGFGLGDSVRVINRAAARIAREQREIVGTPALIAGAIGPTGLSIGPFGRESREKVLAAFREQISALYEAGVDLLSIETMPGTAEAAMAIQAAREVSDLPIVAMLSFAEDGRSISGDDARAAVEVLLSFDVNVLGANCSVGPQRILHVIESYQEALLKEGVTRPLACLPNAGWPTQVADRVIYPSSAEYFADFARQAIELGVAIVGGCCGTTPSHIEAMAAVVQVEPQTPSRPPKIHFEPERVVTAESGDDFRLSDSGPDSFRSKLGRKFVVSVEIDPPKGLSKSKAIAGAEMLHQAGVDAINVADSPMARVRMSALTLCMLIHQDVGIESIVHFTTRDRSLMGIQSELLGAHAAGVRSILALTGDPPTLGNYPGSTGVYDINSIGLIKLLRNMNEGVDSAGASIGDRASFLIGCAVDPTRKDLALEAERLHEKIAAGAHFVMTQPIFDVEVWLKFVEAYGQDIEVPLLAGILPLQSTKHAEFLHNEVPGITLTDSARSRMRDAGPQGRREGVAMAQELLRDLRPYAQGVYLMPSFGRYEVAAEVLDVLEAPASV